MSWHAHLSIDYTLESGKTLARHQHSGPLRILQSLYPEGDTICHNVLVHPPGGLVGGDTLEIAVHAHAGSHGLITTPGATRFYRSEGALALQTTHLQLDSASRLEWLPLEALCYSACQAENRLTMDVAPGAELIGWDVTALGLPHADQPFVLGQFHQHIEVPGVWLERGTLAAEDTRLLDGPVGLAGQRCMASLFFVAGTALSRQRRELALDSVHCATRAGLHGGGDLPQPPGGGGAGDCTGGGARDGPAPCPARRVAQHAVGRCAFEPTHLVYLSPFF
jgi:urease accessory protein